MNDVKFDPAIEGSRKGVGGPKRRAPGAWALSAVFIATAVAAAWPFVSNDEVQAAFFSTLAATSMTILGLVLSLCFIGAQLTSNPGRVSFEHAFRPLTWLYLGFFMASATWALSLSYFAGEQGVHSQFCASAFGESFCVSQIASGRIAIFGFVLSLLWLLPFIAALFNGLRPESAFTRTSGALVAARTSSQAATAAQRFRRDILSLAGNADVIATALDILVTDARGVLATPRRRKIAPDELVGQVTRILGDTNRAMHAHPQSLISVTDAFREWTPFLIEERDKYAATNKAVTTTSATSINVVIHNLREWRNGEFPFGVARSNVNLAIEMAEAAGRGHRRVRMTRAAEEIGNCAKTVVDAPDGDERHLSLFIRGLIRMAEVSITSKIDIGRGIIGDQLQQVLLHVALEQRTVGISTLHGLHDHMHFLTESPGHEAQVRGLAGSLAAWRPDGLAKIVRGTGETKKHPKEGHHLEWVWEVYLAAANGDWAEQAKLCATHLVGEYLRQSNIPEALSVFEDLAKRYEDAAGWVNPVMLWSSKRITECFETTPELITDARVRRRTRRGMPT